MNDWQQALRLMQCEATAYQIEQLQHYLALLQRWNKVYNLTAVRNPNDMLPLHIYDSLSVVAHLPEGSVLDVGAGAGLPGIPLAIMNPERAVTLVDSNGKKTRFIQQAIIDLGLENAQVVHGRVEQLEAQLALSDQQQPLDTTTVSTVTKFDVIISRAFASLEDFVNTSGRYLKTSGYLCAMKGKLPEREMADLPVGYNVVESIALQVPNVDAQRHLIKITCTK